MRSPLKRIARYSRVAAVSLVLGVSLSMVQSPIDEPFTFLRTHAEFSQSDISSLNRGVPVAKVLATKDPSEVAIFGAIRVNVTPEVFLQKYKDITSFKKSKEVLQIGKFGNPPQREEIQSLKLDPAEVNSLKGCAVGACSMKLTAEMIQRLKESVDWSSPSAHEKASQLFRQMLFQYVDAYVSKGNPALAVYADKSPTVALADQFRSLLQASPYLKQYVPEFESTLLNYPSIRLPEGEGFVYWSKEQFGVKPVVSITHVTIEKTTSSGVTSIVIGAKQIYANHYFTTSLGLAAFTPAPTAGGLTGGYLMYLNRSRVDLLGGFLSFFRRWVLNRRLRRGIEENLLMTKQRLEG